MKKLFSILLIAVIIVSCASTRKAVDSWMGHNKSELILKLGPPQRTASDGNGGEVLIYETQVWMNSGNYEYPITSSRMFYADSTGRIYHWRAQGL
jgi:hypothetical protein